MSHTDPELSVILLLLLFLAQTPSWGSLYPGMTWGCSLGPLYFTPYRLCLEKKTVTMSWIRFPLQNPHLLPRVSSSWTSESVQYQPLSSENIQTTLDALPTCSPLFFPPSALYVGHEFTTQANLRHRHHPFLCLDLHQQVFSVWNSEDLLPLLACGSAASFPLLLAGVRVSTDLSLVQSLEWHDWKINLKLLSAFSY